MTLATLVGVNLRRRLRRTLLTVLGVAVAFFLFVMLRSVITTLNASAEMSSATRLVARNQIGIVFPLPISYGNRLRAVEGVTALTWANWFGGLYVDERNFFPQLAIDAESYLPLHPEVQVDAAQRQAFLADRTGALAARSLVERFGWRLGQTVTLRGTIFEGEHRFTLRGVFEPGSPGFDGVFFLHWKYLQERYRDAEYLQNVGWYILGIRNPADAPRIARAIDALYENSAAATRTETEQAFQHSFITMYGNVSLYLNLIGMAVVFAILLVAANTMAMSARERFAEIAVLKTLGFGDGTVLALVLAEAGAIAVAGLLLGLGGAGLLFNLRDLSFGGMIPGMSVAGETVALAAGIALLLALVSGAVPAWQSARLQVVQALRHVA